MTGQWAAVLDKILPEPGIDLGIDLGILRDPEAVAAAATTAMRHTRARLNASTDDLQTVLDVLFAEAIS